MSQESILKILRKHPEGMTAKQLTGKDGNPRTVYKNLSRLTNCGEVIVRVIKRDAYYISVYFYLED